MRYLFIRAMIEEHYDELTRTEKDIADFFLGSFPRPFLWSPTVYRTICMFRKRL